ncbi:DMT family transporter [Faecalicatena sp. Marseille-Q4148]|nr:DMT family transporter [Faecalicatena sp. Marseille-Q4148]
MAGWIIALISGALMSVQGVFNTEVTKTAGMWVSNGWVQFSAFLTCVAVWLFTGRDSIAALTKVQPRFMLVGGVIGAGITWTVIASMKQLGPARAVLLIVVSQILAAHLIELFGLFGVEQAQFEWRKAIGMALAIAGVMIFQWK